MWKILGVNRKTECVGVSTHAKQRLYDRFKSLCHGRADFADIIKDAFCMGDVVHVHDETRTVVVLFGNIRMVSIALRNKFVVKTIMDEQVRIERLNENRPYKSAINKDKAKRVNKNGAAKDSRRKRGGGNKRFNHFK